MTRRGDVVIAVFPYVGGVRQQESAGRGGAV